MARFEVLERHPSAAQHAIAESDKAVERVNIPRTMQLAPDEVLLNMEIEFCDGLSVDDLEAAVDRLENTIQKRHPEVKQIFIEAESLHSATGARRHRHGDFPEQRRAS